MPSAVAEVATPTTVVGWRVFAIHRGQLAAPFQLRYWPSASDRLVWQAGMNHAQCLDRPGCRTPAPDCTCGFRATENQYHLRKSLQRPFEGSEQPIQEECGILARVRLSGRILPGVDIGNDDPETTWRSSQAEIIELHLAPRHDAIAQTLKMNYEVPVAVYETDDEWLHSVVPIDPMGPKHEISEREFIHAISGLTFGEAGNLGEVFAKVKPNTWELAIADDLKNKGLKAAEAMATEVPAPDLARALWDHELKPTMTETTAFVDAVIEHLYPYHPDTVRRVAMFTQPPTMRDVLNRDMKWAIHGVRRAVSSL